METAERYYEILGITPSSSLLEINQAYIRAINALLPSRSSTDPGVQAKAQSRAKDINDAYERIKKAYGADEHHQAAVGTAAQPPSPLNAPVPSPHHITAVNKGMAFKTALEKAAADKALSDRAAEEQALAGKAAAAIAAADATAASIAAAIVSATDPDSQARVSAARAAAERDAAERIAAAKAIAAKAAAAKAAEERAAARARMTALVGQGFLLVTLCVVTYIVCTKAILPLASARKGVSGATIPRRSTPHLPPPRREAKPASPVSQLPDVSVAATSGAEKPVENIATPTAVPSPVRGQSPMNVPAIRKAAEEGDAEAQKNLADIYAEGKAVTKDLREAVKWYRKAANRGNAEAQAALEIWNSQ